MLQLKKISKAYSTGGFSQQALKEVDIDFRKSEFVAILGQSGSGKTTLLNIVGGLDRYDSGDLIINGKSTRKFKNREWDAYRNNSVGFIFQSYNLISHISVLKNVEMGMTLSGVSAKKRRQKAMEVLERVGLKEHAKKKPGQLSGGQMQRVAIARSLANDPDIILADEPTGALDSETSVQIMDLIQEIAKDKLVIMVTHNPDLARDYANRIVELKDGEVVSDSNPIADEPLTHDYSFKKTAMSFFTALKLSSNNILTKKMRTILTSFASSIGIIGIALVLSLSNGFQIKIDEFEAETLSEYPIIISQQSVSLDSDSISDYLEAEQAASYPDVNVVYPYDSAANTIMHANPLSEEYVDYLESIDPALLSGISYTRITGLNLLAQHGDKVKRISTQKVTFAALPKSLDSTESSVLENNYDVLHGALPKDKTDLILVVDYQNRIDADILDALGYGDTDLSEIPFADIIGKEFRLIHNDKYYAQLGDTYLPNISVKAAYNSDTALTLKVCGIVRAKEDSMLPILSTGFAYTSDLTDYVIEQAKESEIVKAQIAADYNVLTGSEFSTSTGSSGGSMMGMMMGGSSSSSSSTDAATLTKDQILSYLGADGTPFMIMVYPKNFESKEQVLAHLDNWNEGKEQDDQIVYTDSAALFTSLSSSIMSAITIVLVAFSAISLVVSMIMIGIITYISVMERTREIGVLRALGARKKDITRVFNAETFIIGLCSGTLGIVIAQLLTIPANSIIEHYSELPNVAQLNPVHAIVLLLISLILTMLGGFIPAKIASKKDPVAALRSD